MVTRPLTPTKIALENTQKHFNINYSVKGRYPAKRHANPNWYKDLQRRTQREAPQQANLATPLVRKPQRDEYHLDKLLSDVSEILVVSNKEEDSYVYSPEDRRRGVSRGGRRLNVGAIWRGAPSGDYKVAATYANKNRIDLYKKYDCNDAARSAGALLPSVQGGGMASNRGGEVRQQHSNALRDAGLSTVTRLGAGHPQQTQVAGRQRGVERLRKIENEQVASKAAAEAKEQEHRRELVEASWRKSGHEQHGFNLDGGEGARKRQLKQFRRKMGATLAKGAASTRHGDSKQQQTQAGRRGRDGMDGGRAARLRLEPGAVGRINQLVRQKARSPLSRAHPSQSRRLAAAARAVMAVAPTRRYNNTTGRPADRSGVSGVERTAAASAVVQPAPHPAAVAAPAAVGASESTPAHQQQQQRQQQQQQRQRVQRRSSIGLESIVPAIMRPLAGEGGAQTSSGATGERYGQRGGDDDDDDADSCSDASSSSSSSVGGSQVREEDQNPAPAPIEGEGEGQGEGEGEGLRREQSVLRVSVLGVSADGKGGSDGTFNVDVSGDASGDGVAAALAPMPPYPYPAVASAAAAGSVTPAELRRRKDAFTRQQNEAKQEARERLEQERLRRASTRHASTYIPSPAISPAGPSPLTSPSASGRQQIMRPSPLQLPPPAVSSSSSSPVRVASASRGGGGSVDSSRPSAVDVGAAAAAAAAAAAQSVSSGRQSIEQSGSGSDAEALLLTPQLRRALYDPSATMRFHARMRRQQQQQQQQGSQASPTAAAAARSIRVPGDALEFKDRLVPAAVRAVFERDYAVGVASDEDRQKREEEERKREVKQESQDEAAFLKLSDRRRTLHHASPTVGAVAVTDSGAVSADASKAARQRANAGSLSRENYPMALCLALGLEPTETLLAALPKGFVSTKRAAIAEAEAEAEAERELVKRTGPLSRSRPSPKHGVAATRRRRGGFMHPTERAAPAAAAAAAAAGSIACDEPVVAGGISKAAAAAAEVRGGGVDLEVDDNSTPPPPDLLASPSRMSLHEFMAGLNVLRNGSTPQRIKFVFDMYDVNGGGTIEMMEVNTMLVQEGDCDLWESALLTQLAVEGVDKDGNAELDLREFQTACQGNIVFFECFANRFPISMLPPAEQQQQSRRHQGVELNWVTVKNMWFDMTHTHTDRMDEVGFSGFSSVMQRLLSAGYIDPLFSQRLFACFDLQRSGRISLFEFMRGLSRMLRGNLRDRAAFYFSFFDLDEQSVLTRESVFRVLASIYHIQASGKHGVEFVQSKVDHIFDSIDVSGDGEIDFDEYLLAIKDCPFVLSEFENAVFGEEGKSEKAMKRMRARRRSSIGGNLYQAIKSGHFNELISGVNAT